MPDPLFSTLRQETEHLIWAPVEQVRRRGRQRTRRTRIAAVLASAAAVAVVASGVVALAGRPDAAPPPLPPATVVPSAPTPTPDRTADPTPTGDPTSSRTTPSSPPADSGGPANQTSSRTPSRAVPAAATLQLADLPHGFTMSQGKGAGDWTLESATIYCDNRLPPLAVGVVATRFVQFDSPTDWLVERVTRHSGTGAATSMQRVRRMATDCVPARSGDSLSIMAEGLGGADSVLVGGEIEGIPSRWLFVRQGNLVAQLRLDHQTTPAEARHYAKLVAPRLCAGTDAC
ncbi:hypothetical protein [Micromonospora eburnea]|uniref:PknH-like extracellular domain-containing protein n=1 Tax=Micromonospora eburnea TaxID=227316 RepID=A0A1C6VP00_9ACTN|nr:hypothetical protein [Micromonospora eburnea]SCL68033.1 hypothetical protein GA0070604_6177 [Micromonospora eburnea]